MTQQYPSGSYSQRTESFRSRLPRRSRRRLIGGVCSGLAEHWGMSPTLVRVAFLAGMLLPPPIPPMWVIYAVAWVLMRDAD